MNWLLDTCVLSELVKKAPRQRVLDWLATQPEDSLFVSVLSVGEIEKGIARLPASDPRSRALSDWLETRVIPRFGSRLLPLDLDVLRRWGRQAGRLERAGRPAPALDGLLAATAQVHELQMATRNVAAFAPWGVDCHNPW
jgi:predicted nucleic acid-binding protein